MRIGVFGGSFDPIHKAHIKLAKFAYNELKLDKMIFVIAYKNPFKKKNKYQSSLHRLNMLKLVIPEDWIICEFELKRKCVTYTYQVINHIYRKENQLFYILGSDNIEKLNKWENIDNFKDKVNFVSFKRKKDIINHINIKRFNIKMLNNDIYENSSTLYKRGNISVVDKKVQNYIAENWLYLDIIAFNCLPQKRYIHSKNTAILANTYAKVNNLNTKAAYFAGLMHDFTKYWTPEEHYYIMDKYNIDHTNMPNPILHQYSGALWIKYEYKSKNEEIYNAILKHTTTDKNMSTFDKSIYLADKLSNGRRFNNITNIRNLAIKNIDSAYDKLLNIFKESNSTDKIKLLKRSDSIINNGMK